VNGHCYCATSEGRTIAAGQRFHDWVDKLIEAETSEQVCVVLDASETDTQQ
jgi:hypothetical protein